MVTRGEGNVLEKKHSVGHQSPSLDLILKAHPRFPSEDLVISGVKAHLEFDCRTGGIEKLPSASVHKTLAISSGKAISDSLYRIGGSEKLPYASVHKTQSSFSNSLSSDEGLEKDWEEPGFMRLTLGDKESAEIGEINLSVVILTPKRKNKSLGFSRKKHGMKTRRDKREEQVNESRMELEASSKPKAIKKNRSEIEASAPWNLVAEITKVVKKAVELGNKGNSNYSSPLHKGSLPLEEEVSKVFEMGKALGFDFIGIEKEIAAQLTRRELEDEEMIKKKAQ
ncbi:hypothetical protein QYF36_005698 [Acer negundo]|nr:hypothetical protein QYF36_005698 [Acer negundo]